MNLDAVKNQFQGRKFGELVLHHLKSQSQNDIIAALQGTVQLLPDLFQEGEIERLIDDCNAKAYEKTFWQTDCADEFSYIIELAKDRFSQVGLLPNEDDLFNVFNIIVLNFAYGASSQIEMKKFIKDSVSTSIFKKIFGKKDISENYRWSIIFKKGGIPQYEMLGDNVVRMLGYYMISIGENGNPKMPWELFLRFNKNGKDIQLTKLYFPNSDTITNELFKKIEIIDSGYQVANFKEAIFIDRITGANIKIMTMKERQTNLMEDLESLHDGTYEERLRKKEAELTFFKVLDEIFK